MRESQTKTRDLVWTSIALVAVALGHRGFALDPGAGGSLREVVDAFIYDPTSASPVLGALVCGVLLFRRRRAIAECFRTGHPRIVGWVVLAVAIALHAWSRQISAPHLLIPSLILHVAGMAIVLGGGRMLGIVALPLLALALSAPPPAVLINQVIFPMQMWTVTLSSALLDLLGQTHAVFGDLIVKDGVRFQVVEGCSGLKSTLSLGLAAILYVDLTVRSRSQKLLLLALVPGLGQILNAMRVTILVLGEIPAESAEHAAIGIAMIVVGVVLLAAIEILATKTLFSGSRPSPSDGSSGRSEERDAHRPDRSRRLRRVAGVVILATCVIEASPLAALPVPRPAVSVESLPMSIEGWQASALRTDNAFLGSVWFQHRIYRSYEQAGESIRVFVGHEDLVRLTRSGYSPKTAIPGSGWLSVRSVDPLELESDPGDAHRATRELFVVEYPFRRVLVMHWRIGYAPWGRQIFERWLGWDWLVHVGEWRSSLVVRIETDVRGPDGDARAWMILRQFADRLDEWAIAAGAAWKNAQYLPPH